MKLPFTAVCILSLLTLRAAHSQSVNSAKSEGRSPDVVEVKHVRKESRVDILIHGKLFTSYQYGPSFLDKPVSTLF